MRGSRRREHVSDVETLLEEIAGIGATEHGGVRRLAWTDEDARLAQWFAAACAERGLVVGTDRCGNQWAWWGDPDVEVHAEAGDGEGNEGESAADGTLPRGGVVTGSHLDSVPGGGSYDGPLGVVTALAAVDELRARGFTPRRAIGVVRFVDEEGGRFGVPCVGSRLLTGQLEPAEVLGRVDDDGFTYAEAAAKAGLDVDAVGRDDDVLRRIGGFVEVH